MFANYPYRPEPDGMPTTYDKASAIGPRRLARNTYLRDNVTVCGAIEPAYAVRLHSTDIVTFLANGSVILNSGGWQTPTTRNRFARCGFQVSMRHGIATVSVRGKDRVYCDGMRINPRTGKVTYPDGVKPEQPAQAYKRRRANLNAYRKALEHGGPIAYVPTYWPTRSGGRMLRGNAPEAFR